MLCNIARANCYIESSPRNDALSYITPAEGLLGHTAQVARATRCDGVIPGHCGMPFLRRAGQGAWIKAGAVGMPADDGTPRIWFGVLTPDAGRFRIEILPLDHDPAGAAAAMRRAGLPEAYAAALGSGIWPSCDVLPLAERARRGMPLAPATLDR